MIKVQLINWERGLQKIALDKLIKVWAGLSLSVAKNCVDRLMDGETVVLEFADLEQANAFLKEARTLGAVGGSQI